jgi:hypothetical protein
MLEGAAVFVGSAQAVAGAAPGGSAQEHLPVGFFEEQEE